MNINDLLLFLKYDNASLRHKVGNDFYTEQTLDAIVYNVEKVIENLSKAFKEAI
ncbi:MAG: hypothetical protein ACRCX2_20995 [Paraclostridium sp.]